jgi:hypothetical protein
MLAGIAGAAQADFVINTATGPFVPSFRGQANTTYFEWSNGSFDWNTSLESGAGEYIANPPPSLNPGNLPLSGANPIGLHSNNTLDLLSSSNNIYSGGAGPAGIDLTLTIPTSSVSGATTTTIIIQGNGLAMPGANGLAFEPIAGISPSYAIGTNAAGQTQWWAKFEIPSALGYYSSHIIGSILQGETNPVSVSGLVVDTIVMPSGFAADAVLVPEPASFAALGIMAGSMLLRRRRAGKERA